jgi:SAM-dependent methyltransferase
MREPPVAGDLYSGRGAYLYDLVTRGDRSEVRELVSTLRGRAGDVLEFAAGAGRLTLPLSRVARSVVAVDRSEELLSILTARLAEVAVSTVHVLRRDLLQLNLGHEFDTVVLGTTTIALFDADERARLLDIARSHLVPGGLIVLSLYEAVGDEAPLVLADGTVTVEEQVDAVARLRISTIVERDTAGDEVGRYSGVTHTLTSEGLIAEMEAHGFSVKEPVGIASSPGRYDVRHHLLIGERGVS